ncbi:hypothetical protein HMN09_00283100 [Mycena chlorophos]|uniref:Uncharacterized protein n=1 Tax=Mycena chlorophos TaxID=658473 RepID=A0A8H6TLH4_MYCCL|nr:hypothetical protein HMN09_00283100 [Mycena chlorophos]
MRPLWRHHLSTIAARWPHPPARLSPTAFSSVPFITQTDLDEYISPLYARNWRVFSDLQTLALQDGLLERRNENVLVLGKKFSFKKPWTTLYAFLERVDEVARDENRSPKMTVFFGRRHRPHVVVRTNTPRTLSDDAYTPSDVRPGLSTDDIRFAMRLEGDSEAPAKPGQPVPTLDLIRQWQQSATICPPSGPESTETIEPLPQVDDGLDPRAPCTDEDFQKLLVPMYSRGWRVAFLPLLSDSKKFTNTLTLTGFFRFNALSASFAFLRDIVETRAQTPRPDLHFQLEAETLRVQLVYPPPQSTLLVGHVTQALRIERLFEDTYARFARVSSVHPFRNNDGAHHPRSVAELQKTREEPLRYYHLRYNTQNQSRTSA